MKKTSFPEFLLYEIIVSWQFSNQLCQQHRCLKQHQSCKSQNQLQDNVFLEKGTKSRDNQEKWESFDFYLPSSFQLSTWILDGIKCSYVIFDCVGYPACLNVPNNIVMTISILSWNEIQLKSVSIFLNLLQLLGKVLGCNRKGKVFHWEIIFWTIWIKFVLKLLAFPLK